MRSVSQTNKMYKDVFDGKVVLYNGYTFTSDGVYWMVDGRPVDTIENQRKYLNKINKKSLIATEIAQFLGINNIIIGDYYLIYDVVDDMTLFVKKDEFTMTFIYIVSTYAAFEKIDIYEGTMKYDRFWSEDGELKHGSLCGNLSSKSKRILEEKLCNEDFSITQNFFYDMYFDGMTSFAELRKAVELNGQIDGSHLSEKTKSLLLRFKKVTTLKQD